VHLSVILLIRQRREWMLVGHENDGAMRENCGSIPGHPNAVAFALCLFLLSVNLVC